MTRDEAIKAFRNSTPNPSSFSDEAWIDRFVALGMLKLDEPKSVVQRIDAAVRQDLYAQNPYSGAVYVQPIYIMQVIDRAGLRIVEK